MYIPRVWAKATGGERSVDGRTLPVSVWGWGDDESSAKQGAAERLQRVLERIRGGQPFPEQYGYGKRPLREEILQTIQGPTPEAPAAIVTRNTYGARVLNAARLLFLDVDFPPRRSFQGIRQLFGRPSPELETETKVRDALKQYGKATFRLYRTASGLRAIAIDREFDPAGREVQELMQATATDPNFATLCLAQKSFRARLTPKPWRMDMRVPPGEHPRQTAESRAKFAAWLSQYEKLSAGYATCRYVETVGTGLAGGDARWLLDLHDRTTRCTESLPLA